jgi:hypothetical protein
MAVSEIERYCVTCKGSGHTYMECPRVSFTSLFCGAMGVPDLLGPPREQTIAELQKIEDEQKARELEAKGWSVKPPA